MATHMFEQASRKKLRFNTLLGLVSVEDLWDMSLEHLNETAKMLNKNLKESEEEDFLKDSSKKDTTSALRFKIVLHILKTKKQEKQDRTDATANKQMKDKLTAALARKKDQALDDMSEQELQDAIKTV